MVYRIGEDTYEFTSGVRDSARLAASSLLEVPILDESYSVQGGQLHTGMTSLSDPDAGETAFVRAVVWEGRDSSILTAMYGPTSSLDALSVFERFAVLEFDDFGNQENEGVFQGSSILVPRSGDALPEEGPILVTYVEGVGLIEVQTWSRATVLGLPDYAGTPARGGELYRDEHGQDPYFILVGERTKSVVVPDPDADLSAVADMLSRLKVEWHASEVRVP